MTIFTESDMSELEKVSNELYAATDDMIDAMKRREVLQARKLQLTQKMMDAVDELAGPRRARLRIVQ